MARQSSKPSDEQMALIKEILAKAKGKGTEPMALVEAITALGT